MDETLQQAVVLIRAGRKGEAQPLLQRLIQADPHNVPAWLWYVETCQTQAERLKVLETCARFNPGHSQVEKALALLRPVPPPASLAPVDAPSSWGALQSEPEPVRWDPKPYEPPKEPPPAWEYTPPPAPPVPEKPPARSYAWYEVWWEVLSYRPVEAFEALLRDPSAKAGRAYLWVAVCGLISSLLAVMFQWGSVRAALTRPEFQQIGVDVSALTTYAYAFLLCMIPLGALSSVVNLMISGAVQNLLAGMFGGTGNYASTAYLLGAIFAPVTLFSSILNAFVSLSPVLTLAVCCIVLPLGVYQIMLNMRALMAVHQIDALKALGVILLPGVLLFFVACIISALLTPSLSEIMQQIEAVRPPMY